jgi:hypothetical protein
MASIFQAGDWPCDANVDTGTTLAEKLNRMITVLDAQGLSTSTVAPASPTAGALWFDSSASPPVLKIFNGTTWLPVGGASAPTSSTAPPASASTGTFWFDTNTTPPTLKIWDGSAWRAVGHATITVGNATLAGGTIGSPVGIGAAWTALTTKPTSDVVIASYAGAAYAKIGSGGSDADWVALGSSTVFATANEITTGSENSKAIAPDQLRAVTLVAPSATPTNDANKFIRLNPQGKIDPGFLQVSGVTVRSAVDPTAAPPATPVQGDLHFASAGGVIHTGYGFPPGTTAKSGDSFLYDGTAWHLIPNEVDLNAYLPLAGGTMAATTSKITWPAATAAAPETYLQLSGGHIEGSIVDAGTF